jgi:drug/metabolite transporter (DMT)-like permease
MVMPQARPMGRLEWAMLVALAVLWGSSFFFFKVLLEALPPFTVVLGRVGVAAIMLNGFLLARGMPMRRPMPWRQFTVMGLLNNAIPFSLIVWGETQVSSGVASILNAMTPVFGVLVAHFVARTERLSWGRGAGVALGLLGVAMLVGPDAVWGLGSGNLLGEAACLLAALSYAFAGLYGRRFRGIPSLQVACGQITGATLIMLPVAAAADRFWLLPMPGPAVWGALVVIALFCTVLAYALYFRILATSGATNLLLVTFLLPVSALLLGGLVLAEPIQPSALYGMALITAGLVAIDGRLPAALWRRRA